jgi:hypothetical protein
VPEKGATDGGMAMPIPIFLLIANNTLMLLAICFYMYERIAGRYWPALPRLAKTVVLFTAANILIVLSAKVFV